MPITLPSNRIDTFYSTDERLTPNVSHAKTELILKLSTHLSPKEQILLQLIVGSRLSRQRAGEILGVPKGTISRRLHRIARAMFNPLTLALLDPACNLPADEREIALAHFLRREPISHVARQFKKKIPQVRDIITYVRGWHRGKVEGRNSER